MNALTTVRRGNGSRAQDVGPGCMAADRRYIAQLAGMVRRLWRGGRVAEGARLESVYTGNRIVGSNPTLSASILTKGPDGQSLRISLTGGTKKR